MTVDVANVIYRHLFQIRNPDGSPYTNPDGVKTGHLIGLCNQASILYDCGVLPAFIFDGEMPPLKEETMRRRKARSRRPEFVIDDEMCLQMKHALDLLGIPWVQAPEEAEAQASYMTEHGFWAVVTNDYDSLLFGARSTVRSISKDGAEVVHLDSSLQHLELDRRALVDMGILIGTDYTPGGIRGFGPKRSLALARRCGSLDEMLDEIGVEPDVRARFKEAEEYYLNPPVEGDCDCRWESPDEEGAHDYLISEMKMGEQDVVRVIGNIEALIPDGGTLQTTLD